MATTTPRGSWPAYFGFARTPGAIAELDGLRALAVLLVLGRHAAAPLGHDGQAIIAIGSWDLAVPFLNGWVGVDLFFVLSGFLITHHLLRRGGGWSLSGFGSYLGARALRIVPAYVAVLALAVAGCIPLYHVSGAHLELRIAYHLLFLQDYLPANIVVSFWSLGVEEKFYLVAPLLVWAAARSPSTFCRCAFLAGLVLLPSLLRLSTAMQHPEALDYYWFFRHFRSPFHLSFDGLAIGVACAFFYRKRNGPAEKETPGWAVPVFWLSAAALAVQLCGGELLAEIGWYQKTLQPLVLSLCFGALLLSAICGGIKAGLAGRILRSGPLLVIARISYPLYLIHITMVPLALAWSGYAAGAGPLDVLRFLAPYLVLSFAAAFVLHYGVEKPFLLLKDRFGARPAGSPLLLPAEYR